MSHHGVPAPTASSLDPEKVSRAGRNLPAAIGVGLLLGALVVVTLFTVKALFLVLAAAAVAVGVWELAHALRSNGVLVPLIPLVIGSVGTLFSGYYFGATGLAMAFPLTCIAALWWRVSDSMTGAARDVLASWLVAVYPALLAGFAGLLLAAPDGSWRIFTFIAVTVASDVGGYAAGVVAGRHPMARTISPKKSWEGFAGSVIACVAVGIACVTLTLHGSWVAGAVLGGACAVAATLGDLMESTLKRDLGVKDMSNVLPGHGGVMDRLDSLVVTAPVTWAILAALVGNVL